MDRYSWLQRNIMLNLVWQLATSKAIWKVKKSLKRCWGKFIYREIQWTWPNTILEKELDIKLERSFVPGAILDSDGFSVEDKATNMYYWNSFEMLQNLPLWKMEILKKNVIVRLFKKLIFWKQIQTRMKWTSANACVRFGARFSLSAFSSKTKMSLEERPLGKVETSSQWNELFMIEGTRSDSILFKA